MIAVKFGTDGIRGLANSELTAEVATRVARAACEVLGRGAGRKKSAVIIRDTRISGSMFECALAAGVMSRGFDAILCGVMPTPSIGVLIRSYNASFGIVASASHNPYHDNGIKLFSEYGMKLPINIEEEIEYEYSNAIDESDSVSGIALGGNTCISEYSDFLLRKFSKTDLKGLSIVIDCANGAASGIAEEIFSKLGANCISIASNPNGKNINDNCGSTHPENMAKAVMRTGADLGLAFDGDSDRLIAAAPNAEIIDGDSLLYIFSKYLASRGELPGKCVVTTVMGNSGLNLSLLKQGISTLSTDVGDRNVLEAMRQNGYGLGGEQSGHIINTAIQYAGDGIANGLLLAKIISETRNGLDELLDGLVLYPQTTVNAAVEWNKKDQALLDEQVATSIESLKAKYKGKGKVLVRPSGTEPKVRVTIEGENKDEVKSDAQELAELIEIRASI